MLKESTFSAFKNVTDAAIENRVDFIILAGDLFDEEDRSVRAQTRLRKEMIRLNEHNIQVYIVHGNHDSLNGSWIHLEMPENVHIFAEKVEVKRFIKGNINVHLYGFSYPSRHVKESMVSHYVKQEGADFDIGILHGHGEGNSEHGSIRSFFMSKSLLKRNLITGRWVIYINVKFFMISHILFIRETHKGEIKKKRGVKAVI